MNALAAWLGTLLGAAIKECAPVLVDIIREAIRSANTPIAEDSKGDNDLKNSLQARLKDLP